MCKNITQKIDNHIINLITKEWSLKNVLIDEACVLNYLLVNIKKNSYDTFKSSQSHQVGNIINPVGITVYPSPKSRETPTRKPLLHKYEYSIKRNCVWNSRAEVGMLSYLKLSTRT